MAEFDLNIADRSLCGVTSSNDITVFWRHDEFLNHISDRFKNQFLKEGRIPQSFDEQINIGIKGRVFKCRACIVSCCAGAFISGTFRGDFDAVPTEDEQPLKSIVLAAEGPLEPIELVCAKPEPHFVIDAGTYGQHLFSILLQKDSHPQGLIVLSGATKSAKSEVARALVLQLLIDKRTSLATALSTERKRGVDGIKSKRLPHLVSFEDPIEKWQLRVEGADPNDFVADELTPLNWLKHGICLTPRRRKQDTKSLHAALMDARRQTPACFYVGEVRDPKEWQDIIHFATSGHLIVVTTHAGSLVDAMTTMMAELQIQTPQARRQFACNLLACIHLRMESIQLLGVAESIVLPAIWMRSAESINSLVAEGPSSITPNGKFVLGRKGYVQRLFESHSHRVRESARGQLEDIEKHAVQIDLREIVGQ